MQVYAELEQKLQILQQKALIRELNIEESLQMATLLHNMDHVHPDGGSRVQEAISLYRSISKAFVQLSCQRDLQSLLVVGVITSRFWDQV